MKWLHLKALILLPAIGLISFLVNCSFPGDSNGSGIGNGMICGKLYEPDGVTPANGAVVKVWKQISNTIVDSSGHIQPAVSIAEAMTDNNGYYSIEQIDPGVYDILASDDRMNMARIDSVVIQNQETHLKNFVDTLKASGSIKGVIKYENGYTTKVMITAVGVGVHFPRSTSPARVDSFTIAPLAEGYYILEVIPLDPTPLFQNAVEKTVHVSSGDTICVTIELKNPLLPIESIRIDYDTLNHSSAISWEPVKRYPVEGYNIYRRIAGEKVFGSPLNGSELIQSTTFVDSTAFADSIYQYAVAIVTSNNKIGQLSEIVSTYTINVKLNLDTIDLISEGTNIYHFIKPQEPGYLYLKHAIYDTVQYTEESGDYYSWKIQKYTTDGKLVNSMAIPESRSFVSIFNGQIFYDKPLDSLTNVIVCRDEKGNERIVASYNRIHLQYIDMAENSILIVTWNYWNPQDTSTIQKKYHITRVLADDGSVIYSKDVFAEYGSLCLNARIKSDGTVTMFFYGQILQFDASGNEIAAFELPQRNYLGRFNSNCFSDSLYLIRTDLIDSTEFAVYNFASEQLFRGKVFNPGRVAFYLAPNGDVYIMSSEMYSDNGLSLYRLQNPLSSN